MATRGLLDIEVRYLDERVSRDIGFCPEAVMKPARWRPRELPGGGHGNCPGGLATDGLAWVYCNGFTPLPESAWVRRTLSPLV